ncbi:MAG: sugar ABC transporter permease [Bacilli bacterium]
MQQTIEKDKFLTSVRKWWHRVGQKADSWSKKGGPVRRKMYLNRTLYFMMLPYLILFFAFTVIPVLMSLALSFTSYNILEAPKIIGWTNYLTLFLDDEIFITAIKNTLILAVITGPIGYIAAFVIAWLINELPGKLRSIVTLAFYAPSLSANALVIWTLIFSSDIYGYANAFLLEWGFITEPQTWLTNTTYILPIVIVVQLWMSLGVGFLSLVAGLKSVNKELYEAGAIDGIRNRWQELWYITLPAMKPQLIFSAVMQISGTLGIGGITVALAGFPSVSYAAHTIVNHLADYGGIRYEMGYASAIATLLFISSIALNKLIRRMIRRVGE